jgi:hypothetical protein
MAPNIEDMSCYKMLPEHKISLPKAEYKMKDPIQKLGFAQPSNCWYVLLKNMKTKGSALLKKISKCYQTPPRARSGQYETPS